MTLQIKDRVWDTTNTTGTGAFTLSGLAPNAYRSFGSVCSNGDTIYYAAANRSASEWEVGLGTFNTGPTLTRTTVLASSNSNLAVNFSAGTKDILGVWPAAQLQILPTTYYISAAGSDSNSGTSPQSPWQTITKVNAQVPAPGSSFLFRGGDSFSGTLTVAASGKPNLPLTYGSYGDGQATISSGNGSGLTCTNFDNLTIKNLTFLGSGPATNTGNAILVSNVAVAGNNYNITNCNISGYGTSTSAILFSCGDVTGSTSPITSYITITQCTIQNCGGGIQLLPKNQQTSGTNTALFFNSFYTILVDHCTVFNTQGSAMALQGVDALTVQYCTVHDIGLTSGLNPGIYSANCNNGLFQFNEVYEVQTAGGHDGNGIMLDFGIQNSIVQYNFCHDNAAAGIATGTLTTGPTVNNNVNTVIRYNVIIANGQVSGGSTNGTGITLYTFTSSEVMQGLAIYNNTIIGSNLTAAGSSHGLITDDLGHAGFMAGIIANNLLIADANTWFISISGAYKFVGNIYFGGSATPIVTLGGAKTIATWLSGQVAGNTDQEAIDGLQVNSTTVMASDPLLTANIAAFNGSATMAQYPTLPRSMTFNSPYIANPNITPGAAFNALGSSYGTGRATFAQLSPMSPVARLGVDLTATSVMQVNMPFNVKLDPSGANSQLAVDFDFKGGRYLGDVIGSITCSRTSSQATDLLPSSPMNASFTTFAANTLRITSGRGLLIEEARTQLLTSPTAPATQTTGSINNGTNLVLWVNGPGSATVSSGTGTISTPSFSPTATHGHAIAFTMTSTGNIVITVTGTLYAFQLESTSGNFYPTSLILSGTRDADVVTSSTGTTIGGYFQNILNGSSNSAVVFVNSPIANNTASGPSVIFTDNSNVGALALLEGSASGGPTGPVQARLTLSGNNTTSTNLANLLGRNAIGVSNVSATSQTVVLNGVATATAFNVAPSTTSPIHLGNRSGGDQALGGYIERFIGFNGAMVTTELVKYAALNPIATNVVQDFFGNPVPYNGKFSVGAHQSTTVGNTVTVNGASAVTVTDPNVTDRSMIFFTLKTVGGTVGAIPAVKTITPGTGFTVAATASDTSTYNYIILG